MDPFRLKIVVFGSFHAGKSTFIEAIDPAFRHVDAKCADGTTTVAIDFGKTDIHGKHIYLFGTPGQERFEFVREITSNGMDAAILMVDCSRGLDDFTRELYRHFSKTDVPFSIMLNKCDLIESCPSMIRRELPDAQTYEISARNPESAREALVQYVQLIFSKQGK